MNAKNPSHPIAMRLFGNGASIRSLMLMMTILPLVASLCLVGIAISGAAHESIEDEEGNKLAAEAKYFAEMTDLTIGRQLMDLESRAALLPKLSLHQDPDKLSAWIGTIQEKIPEYTWIGFADARGQIKAATRDMLIGERVDHREWFLRGRDQSATVDIHDALMLEPLLSKRSDGPWRFIDITSPVRDAEGALIGVIGAHLSWDWLLLQQRRFSDSLLRERHAEVIVAGQDGIARLIGPDVRKTHLADLRSFQLAKAGQSGWIRETWPDQRDYLVGYAKNPGYGDGHQLGWITLIRLPVESVDTLIDPTLLLIWMLIGGTIIIFVLGIQAILGLTLRPVEQLVADIETVARYGGRVDIDPRTPKEFQALSHATNQLILAMEAGRAADQSKTRFLADMSHEIRNPLHGLIGHAELLKRRLLEPQDQGDVEHLIRCAKELTELLDQILDLSAIEENELRFNEQPLSLEELVRFNAEVFRSLAVQKDLAFDAHMSGLSGLWVKADRLRLGQMIRNLLSNAVKFTQQGSIRLEVKATRETHFDLEDDDTTWVQITVAVTDTGIGLTQQQQELIFGRYQQASTVSTKKLGGTGLGLSVTRGLVQAMNGRISLESLPGVGTNVRINLRLAIASKPTTMAMPEPANIIDGQNDSEHASQNISKTTRSLRVMVVDDIDTNRDVLARWLELHGHVVDQAATGQDAIAKATQECFDVILMDIDLPDMNGRDAARAIRDPKSSSCKTRIIAVSGHAFAHDISASKNSGIDEHLGKPIDFEALLQMII